MARKEISQMSPEELFGDNRLGKPGERASLDSAMSSDFFGRGVQGNGRLSLSRSDLGAFRQVSSMTFGGDRRYSGGAIGMASMLGSHGLSVGRRATCESSTELEDSRAGSFLSDPGTGPDTTSIDAGGGYGYGPGGNDGSARLLSVGQAALSNNTSRGESVDGDAVDINRVVVHPAEIADQ